MGSVGLNPGQMHTSMQETKTKKLRLCGHGEMRKRRCRQKKRWEDNIKTWKGRGFAKSARSAENRPRWKGIVAN